jgi:hypothetical protein
MALSLSVPLHVSERTPPSELAPGFGNCEAATLPLMFVKLGCVQVGAALSLSVEAQVFAPHAPVPL